MLYCIVDINRNLWENIQFLYSTWSERGCRWSPRNFVVIFSVNCKQTSEVAGKKAGVTQAKMRTGIDDVKEVECGCVIRLSNQIAVGAPLDPCYRCICLKTFLGYNHYSGRFAHFRCVFQYFEKWSLNSGEKLLHFVRIRLRHWSSATILHATVAMWN